MEAFLPQSIDSREQTWIPVGGNDRDFAHLLHILNPIRYVRTHTKREFMDKLEWVLRISIALCFIGHGFWGVASKPEWVGLITPMGFSKETAINLLPWIGCGDILLGFLMIMRPRAVIVWKAFLWALFTPFLRPLAGMSWFEVPERAGNYGIPFAYLVMVGSMGLMTTLWKGFEVTNEPESKLSDAAIRKVKCILQISLGLLLIGHGGLVAFVQDQMYIDHIALFGIGATPSMLTAIGWFEIIVGLVVALRPVAPLVWFVLAWKLFTESLFPFGGRAVDVFETVERWGDYGGCIALLLILYYLGRQSRAPSLKVKNLR